MTTVRYLGTLTLCGLFLGGCPSPAALHDSLARLDEAHERLLELATELERFKSHTSTEIEALKREQERLGRELIRARTAASDAQTDLQSNEYHLSNERLSREQAEQLVARLGSDRQRLEDKAEYLEGRVDRVQADLNRAQEAYGRTAGRLEMLEREHVTLTQEVAEARATIVRTQMALESARKNLAQAREIRREAEARASRVEDRARQADRLEKELRAERDRLAAQIEALRVSLSGAAARISGLERDNQHIASALAAAKARAHALESLLAKERELGHEREKTFQRLQRPVETPTR